MARLSLAEARAVLTDAGFEIVSEFSAESLVHRAEQAAMEQPVDIAGNSVLKTVDDLRPSRSSA